MKTLLATACLLVVLTAPATGVAERPKKPPVVPSAITFSFPPPAAGQRSVAITGQATGAKGCRSGRTARIGSLSGGSAPPTVPLDVGAKGRFTTTYSVSGPGSVEVFVALLPSRRKKKGEKITCGPAIDQATIPFS